MTEIEFHEMILSLWPTYKLTEDFAASIFRRRAHFGDQLTWAVKRERADHPDAYKPIWKRIDEDLQHTETEARRYKSELQCLLDFCRRQNQKNPVPGHEQLSDEEIYNRHIRANTMTITHDHMNNWEPRPDPDGRRKRNAENQTRWMADKYARDLEEKRLEVPPWLERQRTPGETTQ